MSADWPTIKSDVRWRIADAAAEEIVPLEETLRLAAQTVAIERAAQRLGVAPDQSLRQAYIALSLRIAEWRAATDRPIVVGICGAQGSGKSSAAAVLAEVLGGAFGLQTAVLSLDDFYLPRGARQLLAESIHPLLRTRGVPGTHDVSSAMTVIDQLLGASAETVTALPRFDKGTDEPVPQDRRMQYGGRPDIIIFEGWCVGARPQPAADLAKPLNALERDQDESGHWRAYVNARLGGDYTTLFGRLDRLCMIAAPSFDQVFAWRRQQELTLERRARMTGDPTPMLMDDAALEWFIMHFERLTRHILMTMPTYADVVLRLSAARSVCDLRFRDETGIPAQ